VYVCMCVCVCVCVCVCTCMCVACNASNKSVASKILKQSWAVTKYFKTKNTESYPPGAIVFVFKSSFEILKFWTFSWPWYTRV